MVIAVWMTVIAAIMLAIMATKAAAGAARTRTGLVRMVAEISIVIEVKDVHY